MLMAIKLRVRIWKEPRNGIDNGGGIYVFQKFNIKRLALKDKQHA
jgi:hypothetical protein